MTRNLYRKRCFILNFIFTATALFENKGSAYNVSFDIIQF